MLRQARTIQDVLVNIRDAVLEEERKEQEDIAAGRLV